MNYFVNAGTTVQHDDTNYGSGFTSRGNVTTAKQYATDGTTNRIVGRTSYDTNGSVRNVADAAANRQSLDLTDNFTNKPASVGATNAYPYWTANPTGMKAGAQYNYYTGLPVKTFATRPNQSTEEQVTSTTYDFADRPLRTTSPTGSYVELGYWDNLLRQTTYTKRDVINGVDQLVYSWQDFDGAGHVMRKGSDHPNAIAGKYSGQRFKFDELGRSVQQSNVLAVTSSFTIDTGEPGQSGSTQWQWTVAELDGLGRTAALEKPDNTYIFNDYSVCGCAGGLTTDVYDERNNRKTTQSDFLGRLQYARELEPELSYDEFGQPYISDYWVRAEVEYQYDALNRLTQIIHRGNGSILASSGGHLSGTGQTRSFTYDTYGRANTETTPEAGTTSFTYTANDQVATTTNANSKVTTVSYNTRNLVTGISYNDSTPSVSYGYDDYGARTSMSDGEGAMSYVYDSFRRLQSETRTFTGLGSNQYTFNYSYNLGGQLKQANYVAPSFNKNINYAYNPTGALSGIGTNLTGSDPNATTNVISAMSYRAFGAASSISYGNNRTATMSYSTDLMRLGQMVVARPDGSDKLVDNWYYYTENGLIKDIYNYVDSAYFVSYEYNFRNQLSKWYRNGTTTTYGVGDWGEYGGSWEFPSNLTVTFNYPKISGTQVPATNRASSMVVNYGGTTNFSYDNAGNMTAAGSTTYQWDAANRLKSVNNGSLGSYGYDGNGKRVKKTESGTTTYYVISSVVGSAMEVTSTGVQRAYVMSGSAVVAQLNPNGQFYWLHLDHLGSGRKMTDTSGTMTYRAEFDPYGKLLYEWSSPTNLNTRKFTGYERDAATNLDYAQARMYSSDWGRFMSPDPARIMNPSRPQSLNLYSYTENNPVNRVDPSGLGWEVRGETVCTIIGGIIKCWTTFQFVWVEGIGAGPNPYYDPRNYLPSSTPIGSGYSGNSGQQNTSKEAIQTAFVQFIDQGLPDACKTELAAYIPRLKGIASVLTEYLFDISTSIGNDLATKYVPIEKVRAKGGNENTTLRAHFSNLNGTNAHTQTASPSDMTGLGNQRPGIYYNGAGTFAGEARQLLLLHEVMHLLVNPPSSFVGNLDEYFIRQFNLTPQDNEPPSQTVSRFFNNSCQR